MNIKRGGSREPKKPPLDPPLIVAREKLLFNLLTLETSNDMYISVNVQYYQSVEVVSL